MLRDHKSLIYGGGLFAGVAVAMPLIQSDAIFCVDNRVMCAPLATPPDDEPSGNEPQPLGRINPLSVVASTGSVSVPLYARATIKV